MAFVPTPTLTDLNTPGKRITFLRQSKDWSQETLAARVHVTQPAVAHWEADRYLPSRQSRVLLAEAFGVTSAFLFGEMAA